MDFIDNLAAAGKEAAVKAKDTAEILKWRAKIGLEKDKMNKTYEAIGRLFVSLHEECPSEDYFDFYAKLNESNFLIEQYEDEIAKVKQNGGAGASSDGTIICPYCGEEIDAESIYCPTCGKNIYK